MSKPRSLIVTSSFAALLSLAAPSFAEAQDVSLTVGRFLGDDLIRPDISVGDFLPTSLSDAGIYGVRVGVGFVLVEVEGSILVGDSTLFERTPAEVGAKFTYLEASALLRLLPGPVAPFVAGGLGIHRMSLDVAGLPDHSGVGYNIGAGLKVGLGSVGARADIRDHITPLRVEGLEPAIADFLGLDADVTLHNFEVSVGLTVKF